MRVAGAWIGLGLGDVSDEVRAIKTFLRRKFSYARDLDDSRVYDGHLVTVVAEMQARYAAQGKIGAHVPGVINVETKYAMGYLPRPVKPKPVVFTVEGHLASMWNGPAADVGRAAELEGVAKWQPVGYDNVSLPFRNWTGTTELRRLLADRTLLPPGTPWAMCIYSQGAIVGSTVWLQDILPATGSLHWRLKDWRATVAFGNPYRERDVVAPWVSNPPRPGTQGISPTRMTDTPAAWREVAHRGDIYAENTPDDAGEHKTSIYLAVMNRWSGHPDSLLSQLVEIVQRPIPETLALIDAVTSGVMFLGDMSPHAGYNLAPCIDHVRTALKETHVQS